MLKNKIFEPDLLGPFLLELILESANHNNKSSTANLDLIQDLLKSNIVKNVNSIKNFLNQTLLHFSCENNDILACELLIKNGADCLIEDNYRQTPFILASKKNFFAVLKLFVDSVQKSSSFDQFQVNRAAYYACCSGNLNIAEFLFSTFNLNTENIVEESSVNVDTNKCNRFSELNPLHVSCYKADMNIVEFLLTNIKDKSLSIYFINSPINEYRNCTGLEETFKGFIMCDFNNEIDLNPLARNSKTYLERQSKKENYKKIINLLIENGATYSEGFLMSHGLSKLLAQIFTGPKKMPI